MAKAAFISDVHSNLEALQAVLRDIENRGMQEIHCLGDVVGYGPDPVACTELVQGRCRSTIRGNHDEALIHGPVGFNPVARGAIEWTRKVMQPRLWKAGSRARWQFIQDLPLQAHYEGFLLVHGSPRDPTSEYVMDRDILFGPSNMFPEIFAHFERVCLVGHTHIPGIFHEGPRWIPQRDLPESIPLEDGKKMLINVGSVGQPRDHDPRACYVTYEEGTFRFHRVEYDYRATQSKIRKIPDLDTRLAERLGEGI